MKKSFYIFLLIFSLLSINGREYRCEIENYSFNIIEKYFISTLSNTSINITGIINITHSKIEVGKNILISFISTDIFCLYFLLWNNNNLVLN